MTRIKGQMDSKVAVNIARGKVGQMQETLQQRNISIIFLNNPLWIRSGIRLMFGL